MAFPVTILKVDVSRAPKGYEVVELAYKTTDGATKGMKILGFAQKELLETAKTLAVNDVVDAEFEKNDKGFWQFKSLAKTNKKADASPVQASAKSGTWETSEERARRQVMIVRQSSISNAIALASAERQVGRPDGALTVEGIIEVAKEFEAYVMGKVEDSGDVE